MPPPSVPLIRLFRTRLITGDLSPTRLRLRPHGHAAVRPPACGCAAYANIYTLAMEVIWSATELGSRRFRPTPVRSEPAELDNHFRQLRRRRIRGYIEIELPEIESPQLTIGFRGEYAVVHMFVATPIAQSFLLAGDGTVPSEAHVQVPVMDELARFTGDVVLDVYRAWDLVRGFVRTGQAGDIGKWHAL
jgi:hypothetical protein